MRKLFVTFIAILVCFGGCKFNSSTSDNKTKEASVYVTAEEKETDVMSQESERSSKRDENVKYFWKDGNIFSIKITYAMDGEENFLKSKGYAKIHKERDYNNGTIYQVIVNSDDENIKDRSMAYFYVEDEKIFAISSYDNSDEIDSNNLQLVYQKKNIEQDDGKGLRYSIMDERNIVKFNLDIYLVETNYFHQMEWGKWRNINLYKTGYGAGRDLFQVEFIEKDNSYSIENQEILVKDFLLEIPQINYLSNENKEQKLNGILVNAVKGQLDRLSSGGRFHTFEYSIETKTNTKLSILFTYDYYDRKTAHPCISAFAVNLDLEAEKIISLDAYKERIKLFEQKAFSHVTKRKTSLKNDGGVLEDKSIDELLDDMDNNSFYFANNKIGIIFEVPYACGGYSIYEEKE